MCHGFSLIRRGQLDSAQMDVDGLVDIAPVPTRHRHGDWNVPRRRRLEDAGVALLETGLAQTQPPDPIAMVRVRAGELNDQARRAPGKYLFERATQRLQIRNVLAAVGQRDIEVAARLVKRVVMFTVQRQRKYGRIVAKN